MQSPPNSAASLPALDSTKRVAIRRRRLRKALCREYVQNWPGAIGACVAKKPLRGGVVHLRHEGERPAVRILEEGHPFLGAVGVAVDEMWRVHEHDAARAEFGMGLDNVRDAQIQDRLVFCAAFLLRQHESRATEVEERERAEGV